MTHMPKMRIEDIEIEELEIQDFAYGGKVKNRKEDKFDPRDDGGYRPGDKHNKPHRRVQRTPRREEDL